MSWKLNLDLWETEAYNKNIEPIIRDISTKIDQLVGAPPVLGYKPIWLINDLYYGMRLYTPLHQDYYKMGLTVGHLTYGKVAYQFANMISLLYTDPRQVTWFSRSLAHLTSFWFLDYLAEKWIDDSPGPGYEDSYELFSALKNEKMKTAYQNIDIMLNLASNEWIKEEIELLCNNTGYNPPVIYDHIAMELIPLFEDEENWKIFKYLGMATRKPVEDINDLRCRPRAKPDFDKLYDIVPVELKSFVERIRNRLHI